MQRESVSNQRKTLNSKTIHISQLTDNYACQRQVDQFRRLFGESVEVTVELCLQHSSVFDWAWAAMALLSEPARAEYDKAKVIAWADGKEIKDRAWLEYEIAKESVRDVYRAAVGRAKSEKDICLAHDDYKKAIAPLWPEYEKAKALTQDRYRKVIAPIWAQAYIDDVKNWDHIHEGF